MIKLIYLLFLSFISLNALTIDKLKNYYEFNDFKIYNDFKNNLSIDDILELKNEFKNTQKTNIGIKKHSVWTLGKIDNKTDDLLKLIFTNPRAGIDFMDIYILKDGKIIQTHELGDMNPLENRIIQSRKSNFYLELPKNRSYEIIIKYKSFGAIDINLEVYKPKYYANIVKTESMKFGLILGIIGVISLIVFYLMIYFPSISTNLFFFILLGSVFTQLSVAGVFYEMGLDSYFNTIISWSGGNIAAAFIGLFPIYYFELKTIMPKITLVLKTLCYVLILLSLSFLFYPLKNDLLYFAPIANLLFIIISVILFLVSIKLFIKKIDGYKVYIFANGFFLLAVIYFILGLLGIVQTDVIFYFSLVSGTLVNISCLGYLIFSNLIKIKKEKEEAIVLINEYSKLSSVGQSMINLSHQWKEPLNHIYYAINNIQAAKEFKDPNFKEILDEGLKNIKETANFMTDTGQNFLNLYQDETFNEQINIRNSIQSVLITFRKQIDELDIELNLDIENEFYINNNKYLLANVFMVIIENSIKVFKLRKIKKPKLNISVSKELKMHENIVISISDNAKGITAYPIESIFQKDMTMSNSTGLGLYLAKTILSLKLNGDIKAYNTKEGACFKIWLKEENEK